MGNGPPALCCGMVADDAPLPRVAAGEFWREVRRRGLRALLEAHGGCVQVLEALPEAQALEALRLLEELGPADWNQSKTDKVYDAMHMFFRYDGRRLDGVKRKIHSLAPDMFPNFHGAMYVSGALIDPHDDSHQFILAPSDPYQSDRYPAGRVMFRKVALIYYLTQDWREAYGGCFVDLHGPGERVVVPRFNSLVAFLVPRVHEVQELVAGCPPRFTVFGWFSDDAPYPPLDQQSAALSTLPSRQRQLQRRREQLERETTAGDSSSSSDGESE